MILDTGHYIEPIKMWRKKLSSEKTWYDFKKLIVEEYHDLCELQHINAAQAVFRRVKLSIRLQRLKQSYLLTYY